MANLITNIQRHVLPNGLTVILSPIQRVDLACVLTWVKSGYFHEPDDRSGLAHLIEHLLFKGTATRGVGQVAQETKALGGYLNASTTYDHTSYYTMVPSKSLLAAIDIQADILMNPAFDADEIEREKQVVYQEMRKKLDQPHAFAREKLFELAFDSHRMRRWRIGSEEKLGLLTRDQIAAYYSQNYVASNTIVVVSGRFDPDVVLKKVTDTYSLMKNVVFAPEMGAKEPPQTKPRLKRLLGDVSQSMVKMGFHTVPYDHEDYSALACLNILMGKGRSSRLYKTIKEEKQLVHGIGTSHNAIGDIGYFTIEAEPKVETIAQTEEEIFLEFNRVLKDAPSPSEMQKISSILEASFFKEKEDIMGQAYSLAYFESLGDIQKMDAHIENLRNQKAEDLLRISAKYFRFENMSILEYVPRSLGEGAEAQSRLLSFQKRIQKNSVNYSKSLESENTPRLPPLHWSLGSEALSTQKPEIIKLSSGATLLYQRVPGIPIVSTHIYFPGGRLDENENNCGITQLLLKASLKGTEHRTQDEIFFEMESMGSSIGIESNADHFGYATSVLSKDFEKAMDILSEVILKPIFSESEIEKEKLVTLSQIRRLKDDMFHYPIELFYRSIYGMHPYGLPRGGLETSLASLKRANLIDWYGQIFSWKNMVISVVGDIEKQRALDVLERHFSTQNDTTPVELAKVYPFTPTAGFIEKIENRDKNQSAVALGFQGVTPLEAEYYDLEVACNLLSGMGGRLFSSMREKKPLAYTVTAFNIGLKRGGAFFVYFACSPEKEKECLHLLLDELSHVQNKPISDQELLASKRYTLASHHMGLQTNFSLGYSMLHHYLLDPKMTSYLHFSDRVEAVTAASLQKTAKRILNLDKYTLGAVRGVHGS